MAACHLGLSAEFSDCHALGSPLREEADRSGRGNVPIHVSHDVNVHDEVFGIATSISVAFSEFRLFCCAERQLQTYYAKVRQDMCLVGAFIGYPAAADRVP
jgi:hypothetical protein